MNAKVLVATLLLGAATTAQAAPCVERRNVGACEVIHARLSYYENGAQLRLWPVGSKSTLVVRDAHLPDGVASQLNNEDDQVFGDFTICPLAPKQPLQPVCIQSVAKPSYIKRGDPR